MEIDPGHDLAWSLLARRELCATLPLEIGCGTVARGMGLAYPTNFVIAYSPHDVGRGIINLPLPYQLVWGVGTTTLWPPRFCLRKHRT